uniref:Putative secreted peptide n=1 Tax=Anopheles braziliensis TaxID=58242 RepID=A0A2M3ZQ87_9DIPT
MATLLNAIVVAVSGLPCVTRTRIACCIGSITSVAAAAAAAAAIAATTLVQFTQQIDPGKGSDLTILIGSR